MGGNIFKNGSRLSRDEYQRVSEVVTSKLQHLGRETLIPETFWEKEDYGDLDVIVKGNVIAIETLLEEFNLQPDQISKNSTVISFFFEGKYQVDLSFYSENNFLSAYNYCRNSDCGNLLGRICHHLGFSFGHSGLIYPVNLSDNEQLGFVEISRDIEQVLNFLGLDYQKWKIGFANKEELFGWVASSPYFNPSIYQFENLNHVNRVRNRKRPIFAAFIDWLAENPIQNEFVPGRNKAEYFWNAVLFFDCAEVFKKIEAMLYTRRITKEANKIFNGDLVREWTGLEGKELGAVLAGFKQHCMMFWSGCWPSFFSGRKPEDVKEMFLNWYKENP